ncbi:hypothetical protein ABRY23_11495 [Melioribacteraceae bacterium 4301-Me]|uniref:hypothetical protein n=1 Tax=Pyranulibacter aquaticus TaxID=3163344 RepID=UPI00359A73B9
MNDPFYRFTIITFSLALIISSNIAAQFTVRGNLESGVYKSTGDFLPKESDLLFAAEGKLGYKLNKENTEAFFELRTRPEWYGLTKELFSFKLRLNGELVRREKNFDWGVNITRHLNRIAGGSVDIDYDIFAVQSNANFYWIENMPFSVAIGYAYQNIASSLPLNHDFIFLEGKLNAIFSPFFRAGYGLYIEKFFVEGETIVNDSKINETTTGYRTGPELELNYLKDFVVNGQYRLLFLFSDESQFTTYEHWFRLVAGKILFKKMSAFLLVDYFWRSIKNAESPGEINVLYSPFNLENNISFKIGYEPSDKFELYLKSSYFRNDLVYKDYTFEGWNFLIGMGISR